MSRAPRGQGRAERNLGQAEGAGKDAATRGAQERSAASREAGREGQPVPATAAGVQIWCEKQTEMESLTLLLPVLQHERDSLQANKEKLECQIKVLEESVTASETRANTAIDRNRSLQEELQTIMSIFQVKKEKLETQEKEMEMLQKEAAEAKALQEHLTRMAADLSEREREIKLYQEQMKMLEKKNLMHTTSLQRKEQNQMRSGAEREAMREELERVAAALKQRESGECEWRKKAQALSAALAKSEASKGTLRKKLTILQRIAPGRDTHPSCLQVGTRIDLQSTQTSLKDSSDVSHKEVGIYIPVSPWPA